MTQQDFKIHFIYSYNKEPATIRFEKTDWLLFLKRHYAGKHIMASFIETQNYNCNDVCYTYKEFDKLEESDIIIILQDLCDRDDKTVQLKIKYAQKLAQLGKQIFSYR